MKTGIYEYSSRWGQLRRSCCNDM